MAFMSLTGWAADISEVDMTIGDVPYGYNGAINPFVVWKGETLTKDTQYEVDEKFYLTSACTTYAKDEEDIALTSDQLPVGTYWVKITGVAAGGFTGEKATSFTVQARKLHITGINGLEFAFGGDIDLSIANTEAGLARIQFADADEESGFIEGEGIADLTIAQAGLTVEYSGATDAGAYQITGIAGLSSINYDIVFDETAVVTINPMQLDAINAVIDGAVEGEDFTFTYNAETQTPTYIVSYPGEGDAIVPLYEGTDFEIVYGVGETPLGEDETPIDAAVYTATVVGIGNYSIGVENAGIAAPGFEIKKAQLNVTAIAKTKVYDGEAFDLTEAQISINGLVAGETVTGCAAAYAGEGDLTAAGTYAITVNTAAAMIGEVALAKNYTVNPIPSDWTISKRPVNLTLQPVTVPLGTAKADALNDAAIAEDDVEDAIYEEDELINKRGALDGDAATIAEAYALAFNAEVMDEVDELELGTYTNAVTATIEEEFANYDITVVKANLVVTGKDFVVYPVVPANIQYGDPYTIGYNAYVAGENGAYVSGATIDKDQLVFVINGTEYAYNEEGIEGLPTELGNYVVTIKEGTAVGTGDNASGEATTMAGNFAIGKKILNVTVGDLVVHAGDPITILEKAGVTFAGDKQDYDEVLEALEYSLTEATADNVTVDEDGIITAVAEGGAKITVSLPEDFENDYYELAEVTEENEGTLTLSDEYLLVLGGEDTKEDIETAETNGSENVVVTFEEGAITMKEREWYAMVLPFNTTAEELVNVLGTYVVVNTLSDKSTDQNFKFTLEMDEIPAGTPFIIKPNEAIDWGAAVPVYYQEGDVIPEGSAIGDLKEYASVAFAGKTIDSEIYPYGAEGIVNIDGTYETTDILGVAGKKSAETANIIDRVWWLSDTDYEASVIANDWRKPKTNAHPLKPMEAYLIAADGWTTYSPVITVEDFDGQTTAIKTLNADKINGLNVGEGWYNLNGVKLQGAPTQKGVYINNGKKVIIK